MGRNHIILCLCLHVPTPIAAPSIKALKINQPGIRSTLEYAALVNKIDIAITHKDSTAYFITTNQKICNI